MSGPRRGIGILVAVDEAGCVVGYVQMKRGNNGNILTRQFPQILKVHVCPLNDFAHIRTTFTTKLLLPTRAS